MTARRALTLIASGLVLAVVALAPLAGGASAASQHDNASSANEIYAASRSAAAQSRSVRVVAKPLGLVGVYASNGRSHVTLSRGDQRVEVIRIGGDLYQRGNKAFWRSVGVPARQAAAFAGVWIRRKATAAELKLYDMKKFVLPMLAASLPVRIVGHDRIGRMPVILMRDADDNGTIAIAGRGVPYPRRLTLDGKGSVSFNDWGAKIVIVAPRNYVPLPG